MPVVTDFINEFKKSSIQLSHNEISEEELEDTLSTFRNTITDIINSYDNIKTGKKLAFVPYQDEFVKEINLKDNYVIIEPIKGMF